MRFERDGIHAANSSKCHVRRLTTMRHTLVLLSMAAFAAGLPAVAHAANPPSGSYQKTCAVDSFRNSVLTALLPAGERSQL